MSRVHTYSGPFLRGLGQDVYDPVTGTYVTDLPAADNPVAQQPYGPPVPTAAQVASDAAYAETHTPNPAYAFQPPVSHPGVIQAISSALTSAPPRPSPTVAVPLTASTFGFWLSNNLGTVLEIGAAVLIGSALLGGRRRRR